MGVADLVPIEDRELQETYIIPLDKIPLYASPETEIVAEEGVTWVYYNGEKVIELGRKKGLPDLWVHPEPGFKIGRCKMIKADGERCNNPVRPGWTVCRYHGAGGRDTPGGLPPVSGRYSKHLPTRYIERMDAFLQNPDYLSMRDDIALLDTRLSEQLERLEGADTKEAWGKVKSAAILLQKKAEFDRELLNIYRILQSAIQSYQEDREAWGEIVAIIDKRRKVADTERRRIEAAQQYLTLPEANAMMTVLVEAVMDIVKDPMERSAISDRLRVFAQRG